MTTSPLRLAPDHLVFLDNNVVTSYSRRRWRSPADPALLLTPEQNAKVDALLGFVKKGATGNLLSSGLLKLEGLPALVRASQRGRRDWIP